MRPQGMSVPVKSGRHQGGQLLLLGEIFLFASLGKWVILSPFCCGTDSPPQPKYKGSSVSPASCLQKKLKSPRPPRVTKTRLSSQQVGQSQTQCLMKELELTLLLIIIYTFVTLE